MVLVGHVFVPVWFDKLMLIRSRCISKRERERERCVPRDTRAIYRCILLANAFSYLNGKKFHGLLPSLMFLLVYIFIVLDVLLWISLLKLLCIFNCCLDSGGLKEAFKKITYKEFLNNPCNIGKEFEG